MKKVVLINAAIMTVLVVAVALAYTFPQQPTQSQTLGFGAVIDTLGVGSIAISSCDGMAYVSVPGSVQIGTGSNEEAGTIQFRNTKIPTVTVDTNATTTLSGYTPANIGNLLVGGTAAQYDSVWVSTNTGAGAWEKLN